MTRGVDFQTIKTSFGTEASVPIAKIPVPGLQVELDERVELPGFVDLFDILLTELWLINLKRDELKAMFDQAVRRIFEFIDNELKYLRWARPDVKIVISCILPYSLFFLWDINSSAIVVSRSLWRSGFLQIRSNPDHESL
jgi:hypothetical protein